MDFIVMNNWVIELSAADKHTKKNFLKQHADKKVLMDLTCFDVEEFYSEFPQLEGACSTLLSRDGRCEVHLRTEDLGGLELLKAQGYLPTLVSFVTPGFIVPRTIATITNEAYFSLEDQVASASDIDRAMKFGVNYPRGPFEWTQGKEKIIVEILDLLKKKTNDPRYSTSQLLRKIATN